jgi:C4-dicarboxylate-specific signal transduction histidine kinase
MNTSLRTRLLGTIVAAILLFFIISVVAERLTLQHDLTNLGKSEVTSGSRAFGGYWAARKEQIRLLVAQDASSSALRRDVMSHAAASLQQQLANIASTSGLSWITITDSSGRVLARSTGTNLGSLAGNKYVARAETGETVATAALVSPGRARLRVTAMRNAAEEAASVPDGLAGHL